jgi:hypothetical protein
MKDDMKEKGSEVWWKVTKETRGGHLISLAVTIATDSNGEGCRTKIIKKMDHHTLIRGLAPSSRVVASITFVIQLQ